MSKISDLRQENNGQLPAFAAVGGYPIFYVDDHGQAFCPDCAEKNDVTNYDVNWENSNLYCDGCGKRIESAYGEG